MESKINPSLYNHLVSLDKLTLDPKNARNHPDRNIKMIADSLERFGQQKPIVIDSENVILAGNGTVVAARTLGWKEIAVVIIDVKDEALRRAFAVMDNRTAELADWNLANLQEAIALMEAQGIHAQEIGFEEADLKVLIERLAVDDSEAPGPDDDVVPDAPKDPKTKPGDLITLGNHRLFCGDATNVEHYKKLVGDVKPDLLFTDPPYGVSVVGKSGTVGGGSTFRGKTIKATKFEPIIGDDNTNAARDAYALVVTSGIENRIIWGGNYFTEFLFPSPCWLVWDKQNNGNFADVELAWTSYDKPAKLYQFMWDGMRREGNRADELTSRVHPTQKPVGLFMEIFRDFPGETVLDLFGGSGSTMIACERLKRRCFMMEMSPAYCDVIIARWEKVTGAKASLKTPVAV